MAASSYTNSTKAKVLASAGVAAFVLSNRSCVEILDLRDARMIVWTLIARTRNPTRARTPINRKRLVNKAEATAAAMHQFIPWLWKIKSLISVTTPT